MPSDTAPSDTVPSDAVPSDTVPSDTVPSEGEPGDPALVSGVPKAVASDDRAPNDAVPKGRGVSDAVLSGGASSDAAPDDSVRARIAEMLRGLGPVLGIDAGGTSTRAALVAEGMVKRRLFGGPLNFLLNDDGVPRMAELIRTAQPSKAGIGVPGIARQPGGAAVFAAAVSEASGVPTRVGPDATTAWLGAFLGRPGIIVIAGTGSVAIGGRAGSLVRIGGHGHLIGDEGGRYWIGRKALRAAFAAVEGTGPPTALAEALTSATGASLDELLMRGQRAPGDRSLLVSLAPVVGRCADGPDPDPVALAIVTDAAAALTRLAEALRRRFGDLPVAAAGGVFGIGPLWEAFHRATGAVPPLAPPEIGAALLAAEPDPA